MDVTQEMMEQKDTEGPRQDWQAVVPCSGLLGAQAAMPTEHPHTNEASSEGASRYSWRAAEGMDGEKRAGSAAAARYRCVIGGSPKVLHAAPSQRWTTAGASALTENKDASLRPEVGGSEIPLGGGTGRLDGARDLTSRTTECAQETNTETLWRFAGCTTGVDERETRVLCRDVPSGEATPDTPDTPCKSLSLTSLLSEEKHFFATAVEKRNLRYLKCFRLLDKLELLTKSRRRCDSFSLEMGKRRRDTQAGDQHAPESKLVSRVSTASSRASSGLSSPSEPTPWGINKYLLLFVYTVYAFLTGCTYFGWPALSHMLFKAGAYSWRCSSTTHSAASLSRAAHKDSSLGGSPSSPKPYLCDEQDAAVAPLFTVAHVSECLMCIVAGVLIDNISPKVVAAIGQTLNALGWILLACSSESFPVYVPAMICIGCGADTGYLPLLRIASLFPGHSATVITVLGAANTASFAIPVVLEAIWRAAGPSWSFRDVCMVYLCVGPILCGTLGLFFVPWKPFGLERNNLSAIACCGSFGATAGRRRDLAPLGFVSALFRRDRFAKDTRQRGGVSWTQSSGTGGGGEDAGSAREGQTEETAASLGGPVEPCSVYGRRTQGYTDFDVCGVSRHEDFDLQTHSPGCPCRKRGVECRIHSGESRLGASGTANSDTDTCVIVEGQNPQLSRRREEPHGSQKCATPPTFISQLCSPHFFCVAVYSSLSSVAMSFLQSASSRVYSESALDAMDLALSLSFLPCVLLGKMIDLFGPFPIFFLMNTMGIMSLLCAVGSAELAVHIVSVIAFCMYVSIDCEQVFCYVECTFRPEHFGKLSGLFHANDGIISLISIPLYDQVTVRLLEGNPVPVFWALAGVLSAVYGVLGALWLIRIKSPDPFGVLADKEVEKRKRNRKAARMHVLTDRSEDEREEFREQEGEQATRPADQSSNEQQFLRLEVTKVVGDCGGSGFGEG